MVYVKFLHLWFLYLLDFDQTWYSSVVSTSCRHDIYNFWADFSNHST